MVIGILALQGAFIEHKKVLDSLNVDSIKIRQPKDLDNIDGIILPGGESTVQGLLLKKFHLFEPLKEKIKNGLPVFATCAGIILLASEIEGESSYLATLPISVKRNAYGRQLGSFIAKKNFQDQHNFPLIFIRAPYITKIHDDVNVLLDNNDSPVAVLYHNQLAMTFHPELSNNNYFHKYFIEKLVQNKSHLYANM
ncbi:pyridoxal 5'-phosphate synthase glutaminase subunit PdxT [Lachnobacterium bovis]|uniref:pyridoxal 5'-phosphate synthase glutaminase subunit PdxT n=1 Tax=Lachnobacterium bovis TaxID=140626 RepID=UPI0003B6CC6A|nr:pyridoxal 5'-phosphate synthase glutaminase subunit PdxT [Lachnobacterium bovis]